MYRYIAFKLIYMYKYTIYIERIFKYVLPLYDLKIMLSNDDGSSYQSHTYSMSLEKCSHWDKTFGDQYSWNKFNRDKLKSAHFSGKKARTGP